MRWLVSVMVMGMVACGPSTAELRTAKTAVYAGDTTRIFALAAEGAADEHYQVGDVDDGHLMFETVGRFYSPEGDLQSPGAGGYVRVDHHSVKVSFIVAIHATDDNRYMITVTPRTWQYLAGSPQMRELAPEDPNLPPWVRGRADALAIAIYDRTRGYTVAPGTAP
jgi:hypothetical protein